MSVLKFDSYDEVIERANATNFGLVAGVVTKDCKTDQIASTSIIRLLS